jgi:hypothetical protein
VKRLLTPLFASVLALVFSIGLHFLPVVYAADKETTTIRNVRSVNAILRQQGRLTVLEVKSRTGSLQRIALSHPSDYWQGTNGPYEAESIAESPGRFLVFADTFESNPGNYQGRCGASDTGERFIHVVALGVIPHETLSVLVSSCRLDLVSSSQSPKWIATGDSAGFVGRIVIRFENGTSVTYHVAPDGSVTRPEMGKASSEAP